MPPEEFLKRRPKIAVRSRSGLAEMWLQLRAWWYTHGKEEIWPRDVQEYVLRRYLKHAVGSAKTEKQKSELMANLMGGAFGLRRDQISEELRDELMRTAFELAGPAAPLPRPPDSPAQR